MIHPQLDLALLEARAEDARPVRRGPSGVALAPLLLAGAFPAVRVFGARAPAAESVIVGMAGALAALVITTLLGPRLARGSGGRGYVLAWLLASAPLVGLAAGGGLPPWALGTLAATVLVGALLVRQGHGQVDPGGRAGLPAEVVGRFLAAGSHLGGHERALLDRALAAYGLVHAWLDPQLLARLPRPPEAWQVAQAATLRQAAVHAMADVASEAHRALVLALHDDDGEALADWRAVTARVEALEATRDVVIALSRARVPADAPDLAAAAARLAG
jgi:hypothetical protein